MERMFKNLLLIAACASTFAAGLSARGNGKIVYFVPPTGYEYKINKLVTIADQAEDDFSLAIAALKNKLQQAGYDLIVTSMDKKLTNFAGLIACNFPENKLKKLAKYPNNKLIFLVTEPPITNASYYEQVYYKHFGKVFTTQDDLIDSITYFKYHYPVANLQAKGLDVPFLERKLCALIGDKNLLDQPHLYAERSNLIHFFQKHAEDDFGLCGLGWDKADFLSYKALGLEKREFLSRYKFCFCFENIIDVKGYVTSKIFDAFKAGCIPVYWGAPNISDYVPADCFIDKRNFASPEELYNFLSTMTQERYDSYRSRIREFLDSSRAQSFALQSFVDLMFSHLAMQPSHKQGNAQASEEEVEPEIVEPMDETLMASLIIGQSAIRTGGNTLLTVLADGGKGPLYYYWSDGQQGRDMCSITVAPKKTTDYTVTIKDSSNPVQQATSLPFTVKVENIYTVKPAQATAVELDESEDEVQDDTGTGEESTEDDYLEEQRENREMLAALSIEGQRTYANGQVIQLHAHPDGLSYRWSGPNGFSSNSPRVSLFANEQSAGTYTLTAQAGHDARAITATIGVSAAEQPIVKPQPVVITSQSITPAKVPVAHVEAIKQAPSTPKVLVVGKIQILKRDEETISFMVTAINAHKEKASHVVIMSMLPECLKLVSAEGKGWTVQTDGNKVKATLPTLEGLARNGLVITARIFKHPTEPVYTKATLISDTSAAYEAVMQIV